MEDIASTVDSRLSQHSLKSTLWGFENEWLFSLKSTLTQVNTCSAQVEFSLKSTLFQSSKDGLGNRKKNINLGFQRFLIIHGNSITHALHCVNKVNESKKAAPGLLME